MPVPVAGSDGDAASAADGDDGGAGAVACTGIGAGARGVTSWGNVNSSPSDPFKKKAVFSPRHLNLTGT